MASSTTGVTSGKSSQVLESTPLSSSSKATLPRSTSSITSSTPSSTSVSATSSSIAGNATAGGEGSEQNAIARPASPVYNPLYAGLLGLLALLILAVLYYLWKLNCRKAAASSDGNQEKRPLNATSLPARNSYAPSDFFGGVPDNRYKDQTGGRYAENEDSSSEVQLDRTGSMWGRVTSIGRNNILPVLGYARQPKQLRQLQVNDYDSNEDVSRASPLPAPITSAEPTPEKRNALTRLFSRAKEPKSPRPARFLARTFGTSSTMDNDYSLGAYSAMGSAHPGEAVAHHNRNEAGFQSTNQSREPFPPPLRKRNLKKVIIGTPQARGVIVPGEMTGATVPLISVEEARARAAVSSSGQPFLQRQSSEVKSVRNSRDPEASINMATAPKSPMTTDQLLHGTSQSTQRRSIHDISRPVSEKRPRGSLLRNELGAEPDMTGGRANEKDGFTRWAPTFPRLATPLINELRNDLLSGRPVIQTRNSHEINNRVPRSPELPWTILPLPDLQRRCLTDLAIYKAKKGGISLDPLELPDISKSSGHTRLQQDSRESKQYQFQSEGSLSPTATRHDDRHVESSYNRPTGTTGPPSSYSNGEGTYDLERSTVWSQTSGGTEGVGADSRERPSDNDHLILEPVQPLQLTPDRPQRRLPAAPRRPTMTGDGTELQTGARDKQYSTQGHFLAPSSGSTSGQRMGSVSPQLVGRSLGSKRETSEISYSSPPADAGTNDSSLSPTATRIDVTAVTGQKPTVEQKPSTPRKPVSSRLRKELENVQDRFRDQIPVPTPPVLVSEAQRPRTRFSDEVSFHDDAQFAFSPPSETVRLVTPPQLLVYPGSNKSSPEILAPQPTLRRGSMMPPDRLVNLPLQPSLRRGSMVASDLVEKDITPKPSVRRGSMMPPDRMAAMGPSPSTATPTADGPPSAGTEDPKAVQTRGEWRQMRKASVTGYYLGVTQDESEDPEIHAGGGGESNLR
ncbi:hypothetical protein QFC22_005379 [Naganishia vaughanmartiniae]|uniref:Uncharacterized protein n=1 Tax=Naganishia vaughanmartiniae TaxID=1424756 RepID=A0ACC2WV91_9TREE|nr:hypothetical protein QFC22_005379 [Naganishia vaughanmartiniae]